MAAELVAAVRSRAKPGADDFVRQTGRMRDSAGRFTKSVDQVDRKLDGLGRRSASTSRLLGGLFAGFTAFRAVTATVGIIGEFDQSLTLVGATAQASAADLNVLEESARTLGATTAFTATESAEGLLFLARAGFDVEESIGALPATLNLAQVGMIGLGEAADFASNIVSQFELDAGDTVRVVDALTVASNRSNTSISQAAEAMKFSGTVLGQLGVEVEDAANLIGVLGDRGIQASQAGTNLRAVFLKLQAPTAAGTKALKDYGLNLSDVDFRTNDLIDIFEKLGPVIDDTSAAVDIFGIRNVSAAQTIAASTAKLRELRVEQIENRGEAERIAKALQDTLIGQFKALNSAVSEVVLQLGDAGLTGGLKGLVSGATTTLRFLTGMNDETDKFGASAAAAATIMTSAAIPAVFLLTKAVGGLTVSLLANPLTQFPVLLAAAGVGLFAFRDKLVTVEGRLTTVGDVVAAAFDTIRERSDLVGAKIKFIWAEVETVLGGFAVRTNSQLQTLFEDAQIKAIEADAVIRGTVFGSGDTSSFEADIAVIKGEQIRRLRRASEVLAALEANSAAAKAEVDRLEQAGGKLSDTFFNKVAKSADELAKQVDVATASLELGATALFAFLGGEGIEKVDKAAESAKQLGAAFETVPEPASDAASAVNDLIGRVNEQVALHGLEGDALRRATVLREFDTQAIGLNMDERLRLLGILDEELTKLENLDAAAKASADRFAAAETVVNILADGVRAAASGFEDLDQVGKQVLVDLATAALRAAALAALSNNDQSFGQNFVANFSGGQEKGGAFGRGGRLLPGFEKGGIVSEPSLISSAEGLRPIAEKGDEAVMPLKRGRGGRLGVEVADSGGQQKAGFSFTMNINGVTDARSFKENERQIRAKARRAMNRRGN